MESYPKAYLYRRVVKAKCFMDAHYADPLDLTEISSEAAFSRYHFIRLFKAIYGLAPHAYLTRVRMEKAQGLLGRGMQVTDVCMAVGFTSPATFSRLFKRHVGVAPSTYREDQLARAEALALEPLAFIPGCFARFNGWLQNRNFGQELS
ncbi:MAG: helix-turn-helix transcriptional regulator [Flavobacteriales bacterium]|nr:HTH-type transcriptional activator RhaR [Flavobacteriales bacterium]MCC6575941.1 helix-turn-helix transcriptional regulator [Flavobacteriales bacterium]NUQ13977.1 helix-turn-helix transcriptional regulator [Flavobacteriales bacterium]